MFDRLFCLIRRQHDYRLSHGGGRMYLQCRRCGVRTPGWETSPWVRVILTQPPLPRLSLADADDSRPFPDSPFRLLLDDTEPRTAPDIAPRLKLGETGRASSDAMLLGESESRSGDMVSMRAGRSAENFRLRLE